MTDQPDDSKKPNDGLSKGDELLRRLLGRSAPRLPIVHEPDPGAPTDDEIDQEDQEDD